MCNTTKGTDKKKQDVVEATGPIGKAEDEQIKEVMKADLISDVIDSTEEQKGCHTSRPYQ